LWEIQALLKMRPVAGNLELGYLFLEKVETLFQNQFSREEVSKSINNLRSNTIKNLSQLTSPGEDIKSGVGGIRDIEFLVQGLQLIHVKKYSELICGNTLAALQGLEKVGILTEDTVKQLTEDYLFLRKIEHFLQIYDDRQIHSLPQTDSNLNALAKRILGIDANQYTFMARLKMCQSRVRKAYEAYMVSQTG
jgi:glutamate-ammonia-ligase adenylyltransferase